MRGPGSIPTGGNIFHWIFLFSYSKASAANIGIIAILVHFEKKLELPPVGIEPGPCDSGTSSVKLLCLPH